MKMLYHAFPRTTGTHDSSPSDEDGLTILSLVLRHGLLCMPERFPIYADPSSEREQKRAFSHSGVPQDEIYQSRACFSLLDRAELSQQIRLSPASDEVIDSTFIPSHAEMFGSFAIGLDPLESRDLGVLPAVYYYTSGATGRLSAGLSSQIVYRLDEIRTVFKILSFIESKAALEHLDVPDEARLAEIGLLPKYERQIVALLDRMSKKDARTILRLFDTDRVASWSIVDFINMLLSLYQNADSTIENKPLAFFHQREWRLIHHMRKELTWFSLGDNSFYSDSNAHAFIDPKEEIRDFLRERFHSLDENKMRRFWVLAEINARPFREFVKEIVVPQKYIDQVQAMVRSIPFTKAPTVSILPPRWTLDLPRRAAGET